MRRGFDPVRRRLVVTGTALALAACAPTTTTPGPQRRTGFAEVNGTRLYYEVAGSGEPVVLVHAFTLDTRMWDDQFEVLARDFRVIRYDARGFGKSAAPNPGEPYSNAEDLAALLDRLDARRAHVVGLSMGGRFALDYAVTYPDGPRSLVVIDGVIGGWQWSREWIAAYAPIVEAGRRRDVAQAKSLWLGLALFAPARARAPVGARLKQMVDDYSGWHFVNQNPERAVSPPAVGRLGAIRAPTLVVVGELDLPDFQRMSERLEHDIPGARRATIPGAGHFANMEAPDGVTRALREFLLRG
ncbi:MAG TPA: alpha/beta fold hydrolase [Burkholderiales bacterium]|nr:alpha/beta fold hydrolase [Burkholderiales bacterium]